MSSQSDDENDEIMPNELGRKLDEENKKLEETKNEIDAITNSFEKDSGDLLGEIADIEDETDIEVTTANNLIDTTQTNAENFVKSSRTFVNDLKTNLDDFSSSIKTKLKILFGGLVALFVLLYLFLPDFLSVIDQDELEINPILIPSVVTIVSFVILVLRIFKSIDSTVIDSHTNRRDSFSKLESNVTPFTKNKPKITSRKQKISDKLHEMCVGLNQVAVGVQGYVPGLKEHFSGLALLNKQGHFALTMRNALDDYGLLDNFIEEKLREYSNQKHNEEQWLFDACKEISKINKASIEILHLCYYDYEGNKNKLENTWRWVKDNNKTDELVQILKEALYPKSQKNVNSHPFVQVIEQVDPFSIAKFRKLYDEFYNEFGQEKKLLIQTLRELRFKVTPSQQKAILDIFPVDKESNKWSEFLIEKTARILNTDSMALLILYADRIGEFGKRDEKWNSVRNDPKVLDALAQFLVQTNNFPVEFEKSELRQMCIDFIKDRKTLDVNERTKAIWSAINELQRTKKLFSYALEAKKKPIQDKIMDDHYSKLLVYNNIDDEIASNLSELCKINKDIVLLFYYDYTQIPERQTKFDDIKKNDEIRNDLADLLLERMINKESQGNEKSKLSSVLYHADDFDLDKIKRDYVFYNNVFQDVVDFVQMLNQENIVNNGTFDFDRIVTVLQNNRESRYKALKQISLEIVSNNQQIQLDPEKLEQLVVALLVIYFRSYFDSARKIACYDAATEKQFTIKLLYEWIRRKGDETELGRKESSFQDIIKPVFDETISSYEHIGDFTRQLEDGKLTGSIKALMSSRFKEVITTVKKYSGEKYVSVLDRVSNTLNNVLKMRITKGFVTQALKLQLISAYILTYKHGSVITVMKEFMKPACDELAHSRPEFKNLIIMREHDSESGKGTRVGVVPLHIKDFEEFNMLFQEAFTLAAKKFKNKYADKSDSFSANLIRIIPSPLAFKQVLNNASASKTDPIKTVIDMIQTDLDPVDRLKLATSESGGGSPDIALKEILDLVFNETTIMSFMDVDVQNIISQNSKLKSIFDNTTFADELFGKYNVSKNTDLSEYLYLENIQNSQITVTQFNETISSILLKHQIQLTDLERMKLSESLFKNLVEITKFMRGTL